ncbi:MAG: WD40 repeat domain-containing protein [Anaerolineae bacterium]|nr:WD40 repeat domain-containing protein [Anaerolineae bacterium]
MTHRWKAIVLIGLIIGVACRPRPVASPSSTPSPSGEVQPASEVAATPTATRPSVLWGLMGVSLAGIQKITPENVTNLKSISGVYRMVLLDLQVTSSKVIGLGANGLWMLSPTDLEIQGWVPLPVEADFPTAMAVRKDEREAAVGTRDGTLLRVDLETDEIRARAQVPPPIRALAYMDDQGRRVAVLADGLRVWKTEGQVLAPMTGVLGSDYAGALSPDGRLGLVVDAAGRGAIWEIASGRAALTFTVPFTRPQAAALHPEGRYAAIGAGEQAVILRIDLTNAQAEPIQRLNLMYTRIIRLDASASYVLVWTKRPLSFDILIYRWGENEHVLHLQPNDVYSSVRISPDEQVLYIAMSNLVKTYSITDPVHDQPAIRADVPTKHGLLLPKLKMLALAGQQDIFFRELLSDTGWRRILGSDIDSIWAHPEEKWVALVYRYGGVSFVDPKGDQSWESIPGTGVRWIGVDALGRGMIGLWDQRRSVVLWAPDEKEPHWQREIPMPPKPSWLTGAVSDQWIAVSTMSLGDNRILGGDTIWLLDFDGNVRHTLRNSDLKDRIYRLEWSSGALVVYLFGSPAAEARVIEVPSGRQLAYAPLRTLEAKVHWWPDRQLVLVDNPGIALSAVQFEAPDRPPQIFTIEERDDLRISGIYRIGKSGRFLVSAQRVRPEPQEGGAITLQLRRGGWLRVLDVDARAFIWERELRYAPLWMVVDPEEKWVILGGAEGALEGWAVLPEQP